jgi:hypothetical protein
METGSPKEDIKGVLVQPSGNKSSFFSGSVKNYCLVFYCKIKSQRKKKTISSSEKYDRRSCTIIQASESENEKENGKKS